MEMAEILDLPSRRKAVVVGGRNPYPNMTTSTVGSAGVTRDTSTDIITANYIDKINQTFPDPPKMYSTLSNSTFPESNTLSTFHSATKRNITDIATSTPFSKVINTTIQSGISDLRTVYDFISTESTVAMGNIFVNGSTSIFPETTSTIGGITQDGFLNVTMPGDFEDLEVAKAKLLRVVLWQWMAPFIFLLGFFGNIAILLVLQNRPVMSDNTTSTYVRFLAIADLCTVITGIIPEWMIFTGIFDVEEYHPVTCKLYKFFAYTASDASIWILVAFSVERFIAVVFPFKRQKGWCKVSQVKLICLGLVLLGVTKNLQSFWTRGAAYEPKGENGTMVLRSNCGYPTEADVHFNLYIRPWLVLVTVNIIPMVFLWFCNFSVIWTISRRRTLQKLQLHMSSASKRASALTQQVTIMCLCASFSFIIFMTPSFILFIGKPYWGDHPSSKAQYLVAKAVNNQLMYINNSINFYLYLFSGERFRRSVISIFIKCQWKRKDLRSLSLHPGSHADTTRSMRTRTLTKQQCDVSVIANNGVPLKSCPNGYDTPSVSGTPTGSRLSLHGNNQV